MSVHIIDQIKPMGNFPVCDASDVQVGTSRLSTILDNIPSTEYIDNALSTKVDKIAGKGLSENDFTTTQKNKLDGIEANANNYKHPTTTGYKHIPSGGSAGKILGWASDGTAQWVDDQTGTVDSVLNTLSTNAIQNKAVAIALNEKASTIDLNNAFNKIGSLCPDNFAGTDTAKIQACMDALSTTGGTIIINRKYTVDDDLVCKLNTDSTNKAKIVFIGIGTNPTIEMNDATFVSDGTNDAIGGLNFININFEGNGTETCFNLNKLIRLAFLNCRFHNFNYCFYGNYIVQDIKFEQCFFEDIHTSVMETVSGTWYVCFSQCTIENSRDFFIHDRNNQTNGLYGVIIRDCCIEGLTGTAIHFTMAKKITIDGCYFEANVNNIDMSHTGMAESVTISNNLFIDSNSNRYAIIYPPIQDRINSGQIEGNSCEGQIKMFDLSNVTANVKYLIRVNNKTGAIDSAKKQYLNFERNVRYVRAVYEGFSLTSGQWSEISGRNIIHEFPVLEGKVITSVSLTRFQGQGQDIPNLNFDITGPPNLFTDNVLRMKVEDTHTQTYYAEIMISYCDTI